jgi:predicted RNase H-like HicB family nuclease
MTLTPSPSQLMEALQNKIDALELSLAMLIEQNATLTQKLATAVEALEYYANDGIYDGGSPDLYDISEWEVDNGQRADEALAKIKDVK